MGCVFKRGSAWYIRYDLPPGRDGKRRQKMVSCRGMTKRQAEQRLHELQAEAGRGGYIDASNLSMADYLDHWMAHVTTALSPTTVSGYRGIIARYIRPELGHIRVSELQPLVLQEFLRDLGKADKTTGRKALSAKTIYNVHGVLHSALGQGVRWRMLQTNPADAIDPPKLRRKEMATADAAQVAALMASIERSSIRIPVLIALATGMRRGEVCGLQWQDFDAERGTLTVKRSMAQVSNQPPIAKGPKTENWRVVPIPLSVVKALRAHRSQQLANKLRLGFGYAPDEGWICTRAEGTHLTPNAVTRAFSRLRDKLGIGISFHGLRHTQATALLMAGVPARVVSERLGHANTTMTLNVYGHVLPHAQQQAVDVIDRLLGGASQTDSGHSQAASE